MASKQPAAARGRARAALEALVAARLAAVTPASLTPAQLAELARALPAPPRRTPAAARARLVAARTNRRSLT